MPYVGGSLISLVSFATTEPPTRRMLRDTTDDVGKTVTARTKELTPRRTGRTADSFTQTPVHRVVGGYASGVQSSYYLARLMDAGVGPHDLKPKKAKALSTPQGPRASAHHPGVRGRHMVANALAEAEAALPAIAAPHIEAWAAEVERIAKSHEGVQ